MTRSLGTGRAIVHTRGEPGSRLGKAKVFMSGGSQAVRIPAKFRFATEEVYIQRDAHNGDIILSERPGRMEDILAALYELGVPDDFLSLDERAQLPR